MPQVMHGDMVGKDAFIGIIVSRDDLKRHNEDIDDKVIDEAFEYLQKKFSIILCETDYYWEILDGAVSHCNKENS